ncbi:MAG TPA: tetratricopeptide repeat protein [Gemmataceae bacterium]|jgi:Flp pilus assembly protein TadD
MDSNPRLDDREKQTPREDTAAPKTGAGRRGPLLVFLGGFLLLGLGTVAFWWSWRVWSREEPRESEPAETQPRDPRLAYTGPFRNIHPDVHYVGDEQCAGCHTKETETFHRHPMGRSLVPIAQLAPRQPYDNKHNNPFMALDSRFRVERKGEQIRHLRALLDESGATVVEYGPEVHYAIGSGSRGYSYVTDQDGYLFQTAISWYSQKKIWDLSPGFTVLRVTQRPIGGDCLFCHANRAHPTPGYQNRYDKPIFSGHAIGCERCHGPGERHIESADPFDIVSPGAKRLPDSALRDAVCAQCHLQGLERVLRRGRELYDFRPGLPVEEFWSVFVGSGKGGMGGKAISHFEQMHLSRCFRASAGEKKLGCISCHDPHVKPAAEQRVAHYRTRCLECHREHGCSLPETTRRQQSKEDSCIDCHMPRFGTTDVAHTAATDHRIPRRPGPSEGSVEAAPGGGSLLTRFGSEGIESRDRALARDLAVAVVKAASQGHAPPNRAGSQALVLLGPALEEHPDDLEGWMAKGWALMLTGNKRGALAAFDEVLKQAPKHERALAAAASLAEDLQQFDTALSCWRRAATMNPWIPTYRRGLAFQLARRRLWDELRSQCQDWLRLEPANPEARLLWISCLLHDGKKADARAEFARIEALRPKDLDTWRKRYQDLLRNTP